MDPNLTIYYFCSKRYLEITQRLLCSLHFTPPQKAVKWGPNSVDNTGRW